jgi:hypothetical protein
MADDSPARTATPAPRGEKTQRGRKPVWVEKSGGREPRTVIKKGKNRKSPFKSAELPSGSERESACGWQISANIWQRQSKPAAPFVPPGNSGHRPGAAPPGLSLPEM